MHLHETGPALCYLRREDRSECTSRCLLYSPEPCYAGMVATGLQTARFTSPRIYSPRAIRFMLLLTRNFCCEISGYLKIERWTPRDCSTRAPDCLNQLQSVYFRTLIPNNPSWHRSRDMTVSWPELKSTTFRTRTEVHQGNILKNLFCQIRRKLFVNYLSYVCKQ